MDPKPLALSLADMPPGFSEESSYYTSDAQAAYAFAPEAQSVRHGRIVSYGSTFKHPGFKGVNLIDNNVVVYKTSAGATWALPIVASFNQLNAPAGMPGPMRDVSPPRIGDQIKVLSATQGMATYYIMIFRRNNCLVYLEAGGFTLGFTSDQAFAYAAKLDKRVQHPPKASYLPPPVPALSATATPP
jgi:hypothetical protein